MKLFIYLLLLIFQLNAFAQTKAFAKSISKNISVETIAKNIKGRFNSADSIAKCAYYWIAENIKYDYETAANENLDSFWIKNSPEYVLTSKKAVCAGYTKLFEKILTNCGVETITIIGTARQGLDFLNEYNLTENHAWNAYKSQNKWNLVDVTWASTTMENEQITDFNFQTDPSIFIISHFPAVQDWQLLYKPITFTEFSESIYVNYRFFEIELGKTIPTFKRDNVKVEISFAYHEYWRPKVYKKENTVFKEIKQNLDIDSTKQTISLIFNAAPKDVFKIEANWIGFEDMVLLNYPEIGFLKILEK